MIVGGQTEARAQLSSTIKSARTDDASFSNARDKNRVVRKFAHAHVIFSRFRVVKVSGKVVYSIVRALILSKSY